MTKEPADWAKIKAYRVFNPNTRYTDAGIIETWSLHPNGIHELARMYDQYEKPPVDPDLMAAREWAALKYPDCAEEYTKGSYDRAAAIPGFLAGIEHGRANP